MDDWRNWRLQTSRTRIECQRHHLAQRLTHYPDSLIQTIIALALLGSDKGILTFAEARVEAKVFMAGRQSLDVIYEWHGDFYHLVHRGLWLEEDMRTAKWTQAIDGLPLAHDTSSDDRSAA